MSDLTDHQRKAGSARTERKAESSRANIAKGRDAKAEKRELRKQYVDAMERTSNAIADGADMRIICSLNDRARTLRAEIGGKR